MQHSYEALDRPGGFSRVNLLRPLRHRDFRLLWVGMTVSLLGDGIFLIAMAWEAYVLWNAPAALSLLGIGMTIPTIGFLLPAGVLSDRADRRRLMLYADLVRAGVLALLAVLVFSGLLAFWMLLVCVAVYGIGTAFFTPAFEAIIPDILPVEDLPAANALDQFVRPITLRLAGPAVGGWLVAALGAGVAFAVDAVSFVVSVVTLVCMRSVLTSRTEHGTSHVTAIKEGLTYVRSQVWLWGTLLSAALAYLAFMGPAEVLLPYLVKNDLGGSAGDLGLVFAAGGIGAIGSALVMGQRGHPRRDVTFMYGCWTLATLAVAGYGLATASWQLMVACLVFNALETMGTIVWVTIKQKHVPASMLGRVSSLDWLISIGLLPLSFALTAPVAAAVGTRATLVGAAVIGAVATVGALLLPGMRDIEDTDEQPRDETVDVEPVIPRPSLAAAPAERGAARSARSPISPELALVDAELAARARAELPGPGEFRPAFEAIGISGPGLRTGELEPTDAPRRPALAAA
jgi:DHA3 family tetracycline resistance protein-like MFS transporter